MLLICSKFYLDHTVKDKLIKLCFNMLEVFLLVTLNDCCR